MHTVNGPDKSPSRGFDIDFKGIEGNEKPDEGALIGMSLEEPMTCNDIQNHVIVMASKSYALELKKKSQKEKEQSIWQYTAFVIIKRNKDFLVF